MYTLRMNDKKDCGRAVRTPMDTRCATPTGIRRPRPFYANSAALPDCGSETVLCVSTFRVHAPERSVMSALTTRRPTMRRDMARASALSLNGCKRYLRLTNQSEKAQDGAEDLDDKDLDEERRIRRVRQCSVRAGNADSHTAQQVAHAHCEAAKEERESCYEP